MVVKIGLSGPLIKVLYTTMPLYDTLHNVFYVKESLHNLCRVIKVFLSQCQT